MSECPFQSRLSAFHDRELDAETAAKFESHVAQCPQCSQTLQGIRAVSRLLSGAPTGRLSQMGMARLHATADAAAKRPDVFPLARALLAVAASVLVIAGAWLYETPPAIHGDQQLGQINGPVQEADWEKLASGKKVVSPLEAPDETGVAFSRWMIENLKGGSGS